MKTAIVLCILLIANLAAWFWLPKRFSFEIEGDFSPLAKPVPSNSSWPTFALEFTSSQLKALQFSAAAAKGQGLLLPEFRNKMTGKLCVLKECFEVNASLRGDIPTHWSGPRKSLRIKITKDGSWQGKTEFDLILAENRYYEIEPMSYELADLMGIDHSPAQFVNLKVNGKNQGAYLLLEMPSSRVWDREGKPWAALFGSKNIWLANLKYSEDETGLHYGFLAGTNKFNPIRLWPQIYTNKADEVLEGSFDRFAMGLQILRQPHERIEKIDEFFELKDWARWEMLMMVFGSVHASMDDNLGWAYNRTTGRFSPFLNDTLLRKLPSTVEASKSLFSEAFMPIQKFEIMPEYRKERRLAAERLLALNIAGKFDSYRLELERNLIPSLNAIMAEKTRRAWGRKKEILTHNLSIISQYLDSKYDRN